MPVNHTRDDAGGAGSARVHRADEIAACNPAQVDAVAGIHVAAAPTARWELYLG